MPANSTSTGFQGVALRNKNTGKFVWSGKRSSDGGDFQRITFTAAQLAVLDQYARYTLDLIDYFHGGWGWVAMDTVMIPGTTQVPTNIPPLFSDITDRTINTNSTTGPIAFTVSDDQTPAASLLLHPFRQHEPLPDSSDDVNWTKTVGPYLPRQGPSETSKAHKVFVCPSARYGTLTRDGLSRTYAATGTMQGLTSKSTDADLPRKATPMLTPTETLLVTEGRGMDDRIPTAWCQSNIKWKQSNGLGAEKDLAEKDPKQRAFLDFRHGSGATMELLYGDLSASAAKYKYARQNWTQTLWENRVLPP